MILFSVEKEYAGVSTSPEEKKMGIKCSSTRTLILEDALVPKTYLVKSVKVILSLSTF